MIQLIVGSKAFHSVILKAIIGVEETNSLYHWQNLTVNHSVNVEMSLEEEESKRFKV